MSIPTISLARSARQRRRAQFAASPSEEADRDLFYQARSLANTLSDGAEYAHVQGNDTEAIERLLDMLHLANTMQSDDHLISFQIGASIQALACNSIQLIAPDLAGPDAKVRELIDQLLDDTSYRANFKRALVNERRLAIRRSAKAAHRDWLLRPLAEHELLRELPNFDLFFRAADCSNYADAQNILKQYRLDSPDRPRQWIQYTANVPWYSRWFAVGTDHILLWFDRGDRVIAERRVTAIALACRLYRIKHGDFPKSLDQLVPEFLPAIPKDPFFSDGRPIGYAIKPHVPPLIGPRPVLFYDPGGGDVPLRAEPLHSWYSWNSSPPPRQYRDISRFAPPVLPKAVNNQPYKSNAPGEETEEKDCP